MRQARHPRQPSPSAVTDAQWALLAPLIPPSRTQRGGRPREVEMREVLNAIVYQNRSGGHWDMLPHDLLPQSTVYDSCAQWRDEGTWSPMVEAWRPQLRVRAGRDPTPSAMGLDSQAVKTTAMGGAERGDAGGKKLQGRQRQLRVDTLGLLVAILITGAGVDDGVAAPMLRATLAPINFPRLGLIYGDRTYHHQQLHAWRAAHRPPWRSEVKRRPEGAKGFTPLEKRGVVERPNAWPGRYRRNRQDDERKPTSSAAMMQIRQMHLMLHRWAPHHCPPFHYRAAAA